MSVLNRNNVNIFGDGKVTLLFAHGFGSDQNAWRFLSEAFSNEYKVVLFDFVGCGASDYSAYDAEKYRTLQGYAQDVLDICSELNLKNSIFVGHSIATMIGVLAAIEKPEYFKKLVLLGPSACYLNIDDYRGGINPSELDSLFEVMDNNYQGWARTMAPAVMGNTDRPELGEGLADDWAAYDPQIAKNFVRATFLSDNRSALPKLNIPSLSIICKDDILASSDAINYIAKNSQYNEVKHLDAYGHCPHLSAPDKVVMAITDYINEFGFA